MAFVVEYLLIIQKADSFCDSTESFTAFLNVDSSIEIKGGTACYNNDFKCTYAVTSGEIASKSQRYFHVRFEAQNSKSDEEIEKFADFLRVVRVILNKLGTQPETLWDDISFYYAKRAYEKIYRVENLMRKLIANFMLVTVGADWVDESTPKIVKEAIGKSKRREYLNVLHSIDFIHLTDFLLKPYSTATDAEIHQRLSVAQTLDDINKVKALLPQSNWSRYFSALVNCDDNYLKDKWEKLYELRCIVAHNAIVNKSIHDQISNLTDQLKKIIEDAISKLPQVEVPNEEVEQIAESAATSMNDKVGEFILEWRELERNAQEHSGDNGSKPFQIRKYFDALSKSGWLTSEDYAKAIEVMKLRNQLVHNLGGDVDAFRIELAIQNLKRFMERYRTNNQQKVDRDQRSDEDKDDE